MKGVLIVLLCLGCLLAPPGLLWLIGAVWGTPHAVWAYRFYDNGDPHNPRAPRTYIDCIYVGWAGTVTVQAIEGRCPWVRFFRRAG